MIYNDKKPRTQLVIYMILGLGVSSTPKKSFENKVTPDDPTVDDLLKTLW